MDTAVDTAIGTAVGTAVDTFGGVEDAVVEKDAVYRDSTMLAVILYSRFSRSGS